MAITWHHNSVWYDFGNPKKILPKFSLLNKTKLAIFALEDSNMDVANLCTWHPMWHYFGAKSLGWFDAIGTRFSLAQTPNLGRIELLCWIMYIIMSHPI